MTVKEDGRRQGGRVTVGKVGLTMASVRKSKYGTKKDASARSGGFM